MTVSLPQMFWHTLVGTAVDYFCIQQGLQIISKRHAHNVPQILSQAALIFGIFMVTIGGLGLLVNTIKGFECGFLFGATLIGTTSSAAFVGCCAFGALVALIPVITAIYIVTHREHLFDPFERPLVARG